jgi:hypothetical protein
LRSVFLWVIDRHEMDTDCKKVPPAYRPPGNEPFYGAFSSPLVIAVDAVGTLRRLLGTSFFLPRPPQRPEPFKAALNAFVAEERTLEDLGA